MTTGPLRDWQKEAFAKWRGTGCRAVVEAVTGTGKTRVGVAAIVNALSMDQRVLVVVPGVELLEQWYAELKRQLPTVAVGRRGNNHRDDFRRSRVLISTIQSAISKGAPRPPDGSLLVADEVHYYATPGNARVLTDRFIHRLGLTATLERQDDGIETYIQPYFETVIVGCDFARGMRDGILAPIRLLTVAANFTPQERTAFEEHNAIAKQARADLIRLYHVAAAPFGRFMKEVDKLSGQRALPEGRLADRFRSAFVRREALLADCTAKLDALGALGPALEKSECSIVFSKTALSSNRGAEALRNLGLKSGAYSNELKPLERTRMLQQYKSGALTNLVASRVLDQGVDIPAVDVGVIIASCSSRRQMIERMGRILRLKPGGRAAVFVIVYVPGTSEDPAFGAHQAFFDELLEAAVEKVDVPLSDAGAALAKWLEPDSEIASVVSPIAQPVFVEPVQQPRQAVPPVQSPPAASLPTFTIRDVLLAAHAAQPEVADALLRMCASVNARIASVVIELYGLDGEPPRSLRQLSDKMKIPADEVAQLDRRGVAALELLSRTLSETTRRALIAS
ncbi:DEAD/DEAH box helicase [Rhodococcus sp. NPDC057297]|uniref:DEAD/DEAH box helicase n=1 Tax=Rhodococcus sp. NPDC057297 TaxID=3346090 RepID=UPI00362B5700